MGIEGMDGLLLLFTTIASRDWAIWVRFPDFCPFERQTCPQYFWVPLNYLQHVCTLYLVPIWRLWMGTEGMDGVLLLFTTIASRDLVIWVRFPDFCPFERQMCPQYFWMPLNLVQHVCTLYLGPIWSLWVGIEGMDGLLLLFTTIASRNWAIWVRFPDFCPFERQKCP